MTFQGEDVEDFGYPFLSGCIELQGGIATLATTQHQYLLSRPACFESLVNKIRTQSGLGNPVEVDVGSGEVELVNRLDWADVMAGGREAPNHPGRSR